MDPRAIITRDILRAVADNEQFRLPLREAARIFVEDDNAFIAADVGDSLDAADGLIGIDGIRAFQSFRSEFSLPPSLSTNIYQAAAQVIHANYGHFIDEEGLIGRPD